MDADRISTGHARALLGLEKASQQLQVLEQVLSHDLTVRKTEALVRALTSGKAEPEDTRSKPQAESVPQAAAATEAEAPITDLPEAVDEEQYPVAENIEEPEEALFYLDESDVASASPPNMNEVVEEEEMPADEGEEMVTSEPESSEEIFLLPQTAGFENGDDEDYSEEEVRNRIITFESVTAQNPQNDKAWSRLAQHYALINENENAIEAYLHAIALSPENGDYHYKLAQVYNTEGRYSEAIEALKQSLKIDADDPIIHCALASTYRRLDDLESAEEHIAIVAPQMERDTAYNQACFESIRGNTVKAVELLQSALRLKEATIEKIMKDSDFDFIRHEAPFMELLDEVAESASITS